MTDTDMNKVTSLSLGPSLAYLGMKSKCKMYALI